MGVFKKSDMVYQDYSWKTTEGDSSKVRGFPDSALLNRKEGYEILNFINQFIDGQQSWKTSSDSSNIESGKKIERMIHDRLPGDVRSHKRVHEWIVANW